MQSERKTRNRTPCGNCKTSKRKCDRTGSRCSRCRRLNLECVPSTTAEWRVNGIKSTSRHASSPDGVTRTRQAPGANHLLIGSSVELNTSPVSGPYVESEGEPMLHSSGAIDCNILDAIVDPLSTDNLWILPTFSTPGQDSTWPLLEEEAIGYFTPAGDTSTDPRVPILQSAVSYLWNSFVERIAPGITLDVSQTSKLISRLHAENQTPLFSAIVFFSQSVQSNWTLENHSSPADSADMVTAARNTEQEVISHMSQFVGSENSYVSQEKPQILDLLSTLVVLCSAYIAREDFASLTPYLECALSTIRKGFSTELALDDTFLFLVRWMGYIHTVAMLGETVYTLNAPDYLSIASEQSFDPAGKNMFFQDVDSFIGMSQTVTDLLYRLGKILRSCVDDGCICSSELNVERMGLQTRVHLLLRRLDKFKQETDLTDDLDHYNESLVHTCLLIFLMRVNGESARSEMVRSAVGHVLESCAAVQEKASVAKLMLFPMFTAGSYTTSWVHRAFIRRRLEVLQSGYCIVNVKHTLELLEERWQKPSEAPYLNQASVCHLF